MLYNLYIYNRRGKCLFYREWSRPLNTLADDPDEEKKLMYAIVLASLVYFLICCQVWYVVFIEGFSLQAITDTGRKFALCENKCFYITSF